MDKLVLENIGRVISELPGGSNVSLLGADEVAARAEQFGTLTKLGNYNYASTVKTLSTALTVYLGSEKVETGAYTQKKRDIRKGAPGTVRAVNEYIQRAPMVRLECAMGESGDFTPRCTLFLSTYRKDSVRLAHMVARTLLPPDGASAPDLTVIFVPEWPEKERQVLVFPEIGVTYVLGTDYFGEAKNAFLRMAMWSAKQQGMLGLHAGTKILRARTPDGRLRKLGMVMFGIAATGKTTHACHDHGLDGPGEGVEVVQDDVVFWRPDGSALGSERGFYVKTEGLSPELQPLLYDAALRPSAILENVMVDHEGNVDFEDRTLTANGHCIVQRADLGKCLSESINLPPVGELDGLIMAFMTRSYTVVPVASKLTPQQAAVAFMLSESIDAAGSDQQTPGTPTRGISASPFVIGEASEDCNRFHELLKAHGDRIECYMLNTGGVGEVVEHDLDGARRVVRKVTRVRIPEMASIIRGIARGTIRWREDPNWMVETPDYVEDLDIARFDLDKHYDQDKIDATVAAIRLERAEYAEQIKGLNTAIRRAAEF
ncbi:MAG: phosphoenolpyruvate carboxykinase (ATP) [Armatimonadetes bacterium]|nr:phosphoenolpyruvate carboxykinase (ATP) [Armatimonadota bacterium]